MPEEKLPNHRLSNLQLKLGYWYVSHKLQLKKILVASLIGLNVILFGYTFTQLILMFAIYQDAHQRLINSLPVNLVDYQYWHQKNQPQDLQVLNLQILPLRDNRYDLVAEVHNPNSKWLVQEIEYQFIDDRGIVAEGSSFIYPEEDKFLIAFGVESQDRLYNVNLNLKKVNWLRLPDYKNLAAAKLRFKIDNIDFISAQESVIKGKLPISKASFEVTNESAYNFWQVGFFVILYTSQNVVGVNYITTEQFLSGEKRQLEVTWYETLPQVTRVQVLPDLNILDPEIYMEIGAGIE